MIPLHDVNPSQRRPIVTVVLIALWLLGGFRKGDRDRAPTLDPRDVRRSGREPHRGPAAGRYRR